MSVLSKTTKKRSIVYTMLLAFVFNLLLPFFATYSLPAQADQQVSLASLLGDKILICTTEGYKWVSLAELQDEEPVPVVDEHYKCPLCFLQVDKPLSLTPDHLILQNVSPVYFALYQTDAFFEDHKTIRLLLGRSTRAPPAINLLS